MSARAGYRHEALPYAGREECVRVSAGFLRAGLSGGERAIMVGVTDKLADVRDELGADAAEVSFVDVGSAGRNPSRLISVVEQFLAVDPARPARGLGEPIYPGQSVAELREAQLHELLLNSAACSAWDVWLGCPYDTSSLDADALAGMRASHRYVGGVASAEFAGSGLAAAAFAAALPPVPDGAELHRVDVDDLGGTRLFLRAAATGLGLAGVRVEDLICAVNEVLTNSVRHGDGRPALSLWRAGGQLVCDVRDGGWIRDPLVGRLTPAITDTGGRGLWLVHHLCDLVQVRSSPVGTSVRMHLDC